MVAGIILILAGVVSFIIAYNDVLLGLFYVCGSVFVTGGVLSINNYLNNKELNNNILSLSEYFKIITEKGCSKKDEEGN